MSGWCLDSDGQWLEGLDSPRTVFQNWLQIVSRTLTMICILSVLKFGSIKTWKKQTKIVNSFLNPYVHKTVCLVTVLKQFLCVFIYSVNIVGLLKIISL